MISIESSTVAVANAAACCPGVGELELLGRSHYGGRVGGGHGRRVERHDDN